MNCRFLSMISPLGMQRRDCCSSRRGHNSSGKNEHKKKKKTAYGVGLPSFHAGLPVSTWDSCLISSFTSCFTSSFTSTLGVCRSVHKVAVKTGCWCPHIPTKDSFGNSHPEKAWIQYMICIMNIFKTTSCKTTGELMFAGWCSPNCSFGCRLPVRTPVRNSTHSQMALGKGTFWVLAHKRQSLSFSQESQCAKDAKGPASI